MTLIIYAVKRLDDAHDTESFLTAQNLCMIQTYLRTQSASWLRYLNLVDESGQTSEKTFSLLSSSGQASPLMTPCTRAGPMRWKVPETEGRMSIGMVAPANSTM